MEEREKAPGHEKDSLVSIVYYTDPLCCWSWCLEDNWQRLRTTYGNRLSWRYCMAGLIPDWNVFHDTIQSVSRPAQMGPVWMEASHLTGVPIKSDIWRTDPPASSYLACIAVKCAEFQSSEAGEIYLAAIRKSVMTEARNIAFQSVLYEIAIETEDLHPGLIDLKRFTRDLISPKGKEAFYADLRETKSLGVSRLPTLIFRRNGYPSRIVSGYRSYEALVNIAENFFSDTIH